MNKFIEFRCCSDIVRKTINITLLEEEKSKLHAAFTIYYTEGLNELFHKIDPQFNFTTTDPHNLRNCKRMGNRYGMCAYKMA